MELLFYICLFGFIGLIAIFPLITGLVELSLPSFGLTDFLRIANNLATMAFVPGVFYLLRETSLKGPLVFFILFVAFVITAVWWNISDEILFDDRRQIF